MPRFKLLQVVMAGALGLVWGAPALAAPKPAPLFQKGHAPHRPMEVLQDVVVEVGSVLGPQAAMEQLRKQAAALGADAVLDVVTATGQREVPANQWSGLPMAVLGGLLSLGTWNPAPLKDAMDANQGRVLLRPVTVMRGTAVRYVR